MTQSLQPITLFSRLTSANLNSVGTDFVPNLIDLLGKLFYPETELSQPKIKTEFGKAPICNSVIDPMRLNIKAGCALSVGLAMLIMAIVFVLALGFTPSSIVALLTS